MYKGVILLIVMCGFTYVHSQGLDTLMDMRMMMMFLKTLRGGGLFGGGGGGNPITAGVKQSSDPFGVKAVAKKKSPGAMGTVSAMSNALGSGSALGGGARGLGSTTGRGMGMFGSSNMFTNMLHMKTFCDKELTAGEGMMGNCMMNPIACEMTSFKKFKVSLLECRMPGVCCYRNIQSKLYAQKVLNK